MFHGFEKTKRRVNGIEMTFRMGGSGPALLLLQRSSADPRDLA